MFENLKIGNRAEISLERDGSKINSYTTRLEIIESEKDIFLSFPLSAGQYVKLPKINDYIVVFYTDVGLFRFNVGVEKYVKIDGLPYIKINLLDSGRKVQRREYFRYEYIRDFEFYKIKEEKITTEDIILKDLLEVEEMLTTTTFKGLSKDVGAGGIRFITDEQLDEKEEIRIIYKVGHEIIIVDAIVLNVAKLKDEKYKYQIRCKFKNITEKDKEKIISFIFNEQRKRLKMKTT